MAVVNVPVSLYVHIPFCRIKCTYCAFNTYVNLDGLIEPFLQALRREIQIVGQSQPGQMVGTIYIGGGTPSILTPEQMDSILTAVYSNFNVLSDVEVSMEANPSDLNAPYLRALRGIGLNRVSIGMQSANANELELFARRHDNDATVRAVAAARQGNFDNLNLDLIYGIPHQTLDDWDNSLRQMLRLQPEHVSLYALGLEDGTPMKRWVAGGRLPAPDDDLAADMYELATDLLGEAGYVQYEISNWAKPDYACRHNLQYWHNLPYPGVGPGAHGFAGGVRYSTILAPQKYIQAMAAAADQYDYPRTPATDQAVVVDRETEISETLLMGLRLTGEGIQRTTFLERFGQDVLELYGDVVRKYAGYGLLYVDDNVVRLTQQGRLLSNMIFRELV